MKLANTLGKVDRKEIKFQRRGDGGIALDYVAERELS